MTQTRDKSEPDGELLQDPAFVQRLRDGNADAFETLVRATSGRLLAVATRFMRSESDAHDALQDAFLQAYKALAKFEGRCSLATWMHSITVRACLMRLRQRRARPEESMDGLLPQFDSTGHRQNVGPRWKSGETAAMEDETRALVRSCIDQLPENYRNVLLLRDIEELDTSEVADLLGVNEGAVKTRLHRARQALRTLLDPYFRKA